MKILIYLYIFLILNVISNGQSIIDIGAGADINVGAGADICADMQTGNGSLTGLGTFCDGVLPVELTSFLSTIQTRDVTLNWITATEINNQGFEIERSIIIGQLPTSQDQWFKIGYVQGGGTTAEPRNYNFTDKNLSSGKYNYRLKQVDFNGNFQYYDLQNEVVILTPDKFTLHQNYPNPFNPATKINYDIPKEGIVTLKIYNSSGQEMKKIVNEFKTAGYYTVEFDGSGFTSGAYFYKLETDNFVSTKRMILIK